MKCLSSSIIGTRWNCALVVLLIVGTGKVEWLLFMGTVYLK